MSFTNIKLLLYIPELKQGGAERQLADLAIGLNKNYFSVTILANTVNNDFILDNNLNRRDIKITILKKSNPFHYVLKLVNIFTNEKPDVVIAYLISAQIYALIVRIVSPKKFRLYFSKRDSIDYRAQRNLFYKLHSFLLRIFLSKVDLVLYNSQAGYIIDNHIPVTKKMLIYNGINTDRFSPNYSARLELLKYLNLNNVLLIGIVANFTSHKGYKYLIRAAKEIHQVHPYVQFIAIGDYETNIGKAMIELIKTYNLTSSFHVLGKCVNVEDFMAGFDVAVSSSITEGFSNSIAEAMSCAIPCVVTDVGDSSFIVADTGVVVKPFSSKSLEIGLLSLINQSKTCRTALGVKARQRILNNFSTRIMITKIEKILLYVHASI